MNSLRLDRMHSTAPRVQATPTTPGAHRSVAGVRMRETTHPRRPRGKAQHSPATKERQWQCPMALAPARSEFSAGVLQFSLNLGPGDATKTHHLTPT
jgi:hypothetical protein